MAKYQKVFITIGLLVTVLITGQVINASTTEPGSPQDPLVTKSYIDQKTELQIVSLAAGQTLAINGGTEIIARSGKAIAIAGNGGGLSDITEGKDISNGDNIPLNHLIIIPRSDGRGIKAITDVIVMVRGTATVQP